MLKYCQTIDYKSVTNINMKLFRLIIASMVLFALQEPVKGFCFTVTAQVDRNQISVNDSITLSVVFEDGEGEADTSTIADFTIVSQSSSSNISIINGKYSKSVTSIYSLIPKRDGTLKIPPLKVEHENRIYTTEEITIEVSRETPTHKDNDSKDIFVEAGISGTSLFIGQQAVYQLRFYSAVKFSNATLQPPSFKGFTAKEAGERKNYTETINGRPYHVSEINYVIIPETAGETEISPAAIICEVPVRERRRNRDPFDDPFFSNGFFSFGRSEPRQFSTEPIMVKVEPLPPYSVDSSGSVSDSSGGSGASDKIPFSGLVGIFSVEADMDNTKLKTGDSATLTITISGKGNIMDAHSPPVKIPAEFKVYDDSPEESIQLTPDGYNGKKVFKKAIVPVKSGTYTIDSIVLSFFNVAKRKYETISTNPITVEVQNSAEQQVNVKGALDNPNSSSSNITADTLNSGQTMPKNGKAMEKKSVEFTGKDILSIKEDTSILESKKELSLSMFLLLFFLPYGLFFVLRMVMTISKREVSASEAMVKKARMSLKAASENIKTQDKTIQKVKADDLNTDKNGADSNDFFKLLHDALIAMVISKNSSTGKAKLNTGTNSTTATINPTAITAITAEETTTILTDAGSDPEVVGEVTALLNEIESSRYGRQENDPDYREKLLVRAQKVFQTLGVLLVFISAFIFAVLTLSAYPEKICASESGYFQSGTIFLEGIKAYHDGDFEESAQKFSALVKNGISNPYLYYNIGNAYIKAGDTGRAILWYERAKKEIPFDPDLRFNLEYAMGFVTDRIEGSKFLGESSDAGEVGELENGIEIANILFFWKDSFPSNAVQYGAIGLSFIFFAYAGFRRLRKRRIFTPAGVFLFSALVVAGCTSCYSYYHNYSNHFAVIISKETPVRSGNSKDATQLFLLHSGTKVQVEEAREDYLKIVFSRDKIGWVSRADAEVI